MAIQKSILNSASNRSKIAYIVKHSNSNIANVNNSNLAVEPIPSDVEVIKPDMVKILRKRLHNNMRWSSHDTNNAIVWTRGNITLEYTKDKWVTVNSDVDRKNFKRAVILACKYCKNKYDKVTVSLVRSALIEQKVTIINSKVLSVLVKRYLEKYPNPSENRVRHNAPIAQECPVGDGIWRENPERISKILSMCEL